MASSSRIEAAEAEFLRDVAHTIRYLMEQEHITQTELANRLGKSQAYVSQRLSGNRNMTLITVADFATALGYRILLWPEKR